MFLLRLEPALPERGMPSFIASFSTPTGLADGLALKELRYAADACDSPHYVGPPIPAISRRGLGWKSRHASKGSDGCSSLLGIASRLSLAAAIAVHTGPHMLAAMATAVVTGAARGLGRAIATELAGRGLAVHLADLDATGAAEAARAIGPAASSSVLDVCDEAACRALAEEVAEGDGSLDVWVNNAGVLITGLAWEQEEAVRRTMLEVNAVGTMNGTLAALEQMQAAGRGHVINVISLAGLIAAPGEVAYSASKHAAIAFTIGTLFDLRRAGIRDIQLSAVCPDGIWTPMLQDKLDDPDAAGSFSGHLMTPEEVAPHVAGLLDRPRVVLTIPRWRGALLRLFDAFPGLALRLVPLLIRDAERRQRRYKKLIESGRWPKEAGPV
jgi:NAD(P)-dependent dehydrogenase (short-subunit alcohol dehydrogenase family)